MDLKKFFSELKRREVYKVAIAYGITAWLIAQIAGLVSMSFEFPSWVMKMIITILIIGFPIALILSWIFEFSSKGIKKTTLVASDSSDEKKPLETRLVIGILILIGILLIGGWWTWQEFGFDKDPPIRSLVVLPFDNHTGNDEYEYFVAGIHSSLIQDIGKISEVLVKSKTTANSFKETALSVPQIATELGIDAAVEGSITCMGEDSVCVQIRLIKAKGEEKQLWAQDYRVAKSQILNFYNNVTKKISKEINVVLTPQEEELLAVSRTVDKDAYDAYLKGQFYWGKLDKQSVENAMKYFELAIEIDPEWADPYAGLANAWGLLSFFGYLPKSVTLPKVYKYLNKALELDPNSAQAHYGNAIISVWTEWDWEKGEKEFLRSIEINPNHALCRLYYAHLLMILRRSDEALQQANIGLELDPLKPLVLGLYGVVMTESEGDNQTAIRYFEKALSIDSTFGFAKHNLFDTYMKDAYANGDYEKWIEYWEKKVRRWNEEGKTAVLKAFDEKGHIAAIEEMFKMNEKYGNDCYMSGEIKAERYLKLGEYEKAMDYLEKDYEIRASIMPYITTRTGYYVQLNDNPRFIELLQKMKLPLDDKQQIIKNKRQ
ncbi:MAG: hypothetical protein ABFR32_08010 [Bacteroidota bacterium]